MSNINIFSSFFLVFITGKLLTLRIINCLLIKKVKQTISALKPVSY